MILSAGKGDPMERARKERQARSCPQAAQSRTLRAGERRALPRIARGCHPNHLHPLENVAQRAGKLGDGTEQGDIGRPGGHSQKRRQPLDLFGSWCLDLR